MRKLTMCLALTFAVAGATLAQSPEFGLLLQLGLKDRDAADWSGEVMIKGGMVTKIEGWRFTAKDKIVGEGKWTATSKDPGGPKDRRGRRISPVGVLVFGRASSTAYVRVRTAQGELSFTLGDLPFGKRVTAIDGRASAERVAMAAMLSDSQREDDYPSACVAPDRAVWCVWQSYEKASERLQVACRRDGAWSKPQIVPGVKGDIYKPVCAWVAGKLWVVWPQFEDSDWNLKAASFDGKQWTAPQFLIRGKGSDVEPAMAAAGNTAYLVWQGWRGRHSDVWLKPLRGSQWGQTVQVTAADGNDWMPQVTVSPDGTASIVWDTYRNGNYDVYLRQFKGGKLGPEIPIAASEMFEAYATVAADKAGRVWIAYEEGTRNWGKDQGAVVPNPKPGSRLYAQRKTRVRVLEGAKLLAPVKQPDTIAPGGQPKRFHEKPRLTVDGQGRIWLGLRWAMATVRYLRGRGHYRHYKAWESYVTCYEGSQWAAPVYLPQSICRLDTYAAPVGLPDGGAAVVWHTDSRTVADVRKPILNRVVASVLPARGPALAPTLQSVPMPTPLKPQVSAKEVAATKRIRGYRTMIGGKEHRILRGDTHRHTEVSWDGSGDGSMVDVWRYGIDAGALDFMEITDHNQRTGPDLEYVWWRTQKLTDVYHNPPHFITLFGYERSLGFPNGHRNVLNAKRGLRTFPMTKNPSGGRGVAPTDTKQLYANERGRGSVIISHTSGTRMGTDWRDNDPELEPVVEIYQGARTSYEYEGAPKSATPGDRHARGSGYQPQGFVWRAWEKGLRLGIIASSDHGSTHISYASVYVDAPTRDAVIAGLKTRHTFGATDNIILGVRSDGQFMGDEFSQADSPTLHIKAIGTTELKELAIVKDLRFVYTSDPAGAAVEFKWTDRDFEPGTHLYYVRVQQTDGQIAWGSPMWVTRE